MPGAGQAPETPKPPAPATRPATNSAATNQAVRNTEILTNALKNQGVDSNTATAVGAGTGMAAVKSDLTKED